MKYFVALLAVVTVAATAAFAHGQAEHASSSPKTITVGMSWWGDQTINQKRLKVLSMFSKEHPGVKFSPVYLGWNGYWTKMDTMAAAHALPDIMNMDYSYITEWQAHGLLRPLDKYTHDGIINISKASKASIAGGIINGKMYALDNGTNALAFVLDVAAFKKAGIPVPSDNWTWSQFAKIATELHNKLGIWGMGMGLGGANMWRNIYLGTGDWVFSKNGKHLGYPASMDGVLAKYLTMVKSLSQKGVIPPASYLAANANLSVDQYPIVSGKSAMSFIWSNEIVGVWQSAGMNRQFTMLPVPRFSSDVQSPNYIKNSQFWSITRDAKHPRMAARVISFFVTSPKAGNVLLAATGVPIVPAVRDALQSQLDKPDRLEFNFVTSLAKTASPTPPPDPPGASTLQWTDYTPQVFEPFMFGKMTAMQAAEKLRELAQQTL